MKEILRVFLGWFYWKWLCIIHKISYKSVVLVLSNENINIDKYAIEYFDMYAKRKSVHEKKMIWVYKDPKTIANRMSFDDIELIKIKEEKLNLLYDYYCFDKFFDNIVFTYTSKPAENMLQRVLDETEVTEKEAVFLALFHLRQIPEEDGII